MEVVDSAAETFTLACAVSDLSAQVVTVVWSKGDTDVTSLSDGTTYTPDVGAASYDSGAQTQTTTLAVSGSDTARDDMEFTCKVTDPSDGTSTEEETVELKFFSE